VSGELLGWIAKHYALAEPRLVARVAGDVLHVATGGGDVAVKLFADEDRDRARLEAELLAHLAAPDPRYRVQTLVHAASGELIASGEHGTVLVTRWEPGQFKRYTEITEVEWRALGTELAALHLRLDTFERPLPRMSALVAARDLGHERTALEANRARAVAKDPRIGPYLDAQLAILDERGARASRMPAAPERPIHNDFNQHNYLFDDRSPPIILDWEGAIAAPREYEVVRCLNHLPLVAPAHASAFVDGYQHVRRLTAEAVRWAIDAALTDHAVKRWPLEQWLAGEEGAAAKLAGSMEVLHALAGGSADLEAFFATRVAG